MNDATRAGSAVSAPTTNIERELASVRVELGRADQKSNTTLTVAGLLAGFALSALAGRAHLPTPTLVLGWIAVACFAGSVLMLCSAVRPNLAGNHGFMAWRSMSTEQLVEALADEGDVAEAARRLSATSELVRVKFLCIRRGVDLIRVGIGFLLAAVAVFPFTS